MMDEEKKDDSGFQDFGMDEESENTTAKPEKTTNSSTNDSLKINNYLNQEIKENSSTPQSESPVGPRSEANSSSPDPKAGLPPVTPDSDLSPPEPKAPETQISETPAAANINANPSQNQATPPQEVKQTIGQVKNPTSTVSPMIPKKQKTSNPEAKKKAILGCLGAFGGIVIILLVIAFIFINQAGDNNPIARLLGINQGTFVNGLITIVNFLFLLVALVSFVFGIVGLFRAGMVKKDDNVSRKKNLKLSLISGSIFIIILIIWAFVFLYLDSKRVFIDGEEVLPPILTEPEETLNLTAPIEIRFDASNIPYDNNKFRILSYEWDFGDEETGANQIVTHTYTEVGRYDVLLVVTRQDKESGEEFQDEYGKIITIANQALTAIFEADPQSGEAPLTVNFDASESVDPDGTIDTYEWDFDEDGNFDDAEGVEVEHEFTKTGTYMVALRVTSTTGEFSVLEKEIIVEESLTPEAVITVNDNPSVFLTGVQYVFRSDQSSSPNGDIEKYEWDFGDGTAVVTNKTASHTFQREGSYEVTLTITDEEGEKGTTSKRITIGVPQSSPKPIIQSNPAASGGSISGTVPLTVTFDASQTTDSDNNIVEYEWDFDGNGTADGYGAVATHTFTNQGNFTTKLTVTDSDGNTGTSTVIVDVSAQGINAIIKADRLEGSVPLTINFDASASTYPGSQIVSYEWDFGDGSSPKLGSANISHRYTSIGTYTAKVKIIGADNTQDTAQILVTAREIPLQACFTPTFSEGPAPLVTTFDPGCSSGTIANYFWDFGDGTTSTQLKPSHTFGSPGQYAVKLEVSDIDNTISTSVINITVTASNG